MKHGPVDCAFVEQFTGLYEGRYRYYNYSNTIDVDTIITILVTDVMNENSCQVYLSWGAPSEYYGVKHIHVNGTVSMESSSDLYFRNDSLFYYFDNNSTGTPVPQVKWFELKRII